MQTLKVGDTVKLLRKTTFFGQYDVVELLGHVGSTLWHVKKVDGDIFGCVQLIHNQYIHVNAKPEYVHRQLVVDCIDAVKEQHDQNELFIELLGFEGPYQQSLFTLMDKYVDAVMQIIGDERQWLSWFIYDNEFGAKGFEAGFLDEEIETDNQMRNIRTIDDLIWLLDR